MSNNFMNMLSSTIVKRLAVFFFFFRPFGAAMVGYKGNDHNRNNSVQVL